MLKYFCKLDNVNNQDNFILNLGLVSILKFIFVYYGSETSKCQITELLHLEQFKSLVRVNRVSSIGRGRSSKIKMTRTHSLPLPIHLSVCFIKLSTKISKSPLIGADGQKFYGAIPIDEEMPEALAPEIFSGLVHVAQESRRCYATV